ncbi:MAG: TetR/AcrR family transcriptional regulator [Acidimicrobiales bacterium]
MHPTTSRQSLPTVDGRTARRDRGRAAVLEAALELFEEDNLEPTPEQIAHRAGLSTRSVYRYFTDREELVRAVVAHKQMKILPFFQIEEVGRGTQQLRLTRFVDSRLQVYEAIGASARAMAIKASSDPVIREQVEFRKSIFRQQIEVQFAIELNEMNRQKRISTLNAIDVLTQVESLDRLRLDLGVSADECRLLLISTIRALLECTH